MSVLSEQAEVLREAHGGHWQDHPDYAFSDWQYEVANNDTRLGYWEWVAASMDNGEIEVGEESGV